MNKSWVLTGLFNFLIAASIGSCLRLSQLFHFTVPYGNLLHTHSHIAILGWLYLLFFTVIYSWFIPESKKVNTQYKRTFLCTQISVLGMMFSFPVEGYGVFSIIFSSLHIACSYYFVWITWENLKSSGYDILFLKTSLVFMVGSTLGIWALGIIMPTIGKNSSVYLIAIQFFLHFQINGWFLFGLFACILRLIKKHFNFLPEKLSLFYYLNLSGVLLTFALSLNRYLEIPFFHILQSIGNIMLLAGLFIFIWKIHPLVKKMISKESKHISFLYYSFLISFIIKTILQLFLISPEFSQYSFMIKNLYLGFIHLIVLGIYSLFLFFSISLNRSLIYRKYLFFNGLYIFIFGFILSEALLLLQGVLLYFNLENISCYFFLISWSSVLFPAGIFLIILSIINPKKLSKA